MWSSLRPGGLLLVEADPDPAVDDREPVLLVASDGRQARPLPWARLGAFAIVRRAGTVGLELVDEWEQAGRAFVALRRPG